MPRPRRAILVPGRRRRGRTPFSAAVPPAADALVIQAADEAVPAEGVSRRAGSARLEGVYRYQP